MGKRKWYTDEFKREAVRRRPRSALAFGVATSLIAIPVWGAQPAGWGDDSSGKAEETKTESAPLEGEELRKTVPNLRMHTSPPPLWIAVGFGSRSPFQAFAFGVGLDVYAAPWLRLNATYAVGMTAVDAGQNVEWVPSQYAEGCAGLAFARFSGRTTVELPMTDPLSAKPGALKAIVPSYRAVFLEGGAMTGLIGTKRCLSNCNAVGLAEPTFAAETRQIVSPFVGLRYVAFHGVTLERANLERANFKIQRIFQLYAHLIVRPLNVRDQDLVGLVTRAGRPLEANDFGGRFGFETTFCRNICFQLGLTIGYSPLPKFPIVEIHISS
ncbi:MAG TPA: hypothetical protein VJT73_05620 [Polyangiaceae bacterium]|nr:hypothetical protein [Polyangiaceae bacterium]